MLLIVYDVTSSKLIFFHMELPRPVGLIVGSVEPQVSKMVGQWYLATLKSNCLS